MKLIQVKWTDSKLMWKSWAEKQELLEGCQPSEIVSVGWWLNQETSETTASTQSSVCWVCEGTGWRVLHGWNGPCGACAGSGQADTPEPAPAGDTKNYLLLAQNRNGDKFANAVAIPCGCVIEVKEL